MKSKLIVLHFILLCFYAIRTNAQCSGCTTTLNNYTSSAAFTFNSGTTCFSGTNSIGNDITFASGSSICVGTGATLNFNGGNFTFSSPTTMVTVDVYGTLNLTQNPTWSGNMTINIHSGATMTTNTLTLNGSLMNIINDGTFNPGTLQFQKSGATITITNNKTMTVGNTLNISAGNAWFKNTGDLIVKQNYNSDATSVYVNCGTFTGKFNLNSGGRVINSGSGTFTSSQIDYGTGSIIENYGKMIITGSVNLGGTTSIFYNEGITDLSTLGQFQGDGNLKGPATGILNTDTHAQKVGYFIWSKQASINNGAIGPNLNFKNPSGTSSKDVMFGTNKPNVVIDGTDTWGNTEPSSLPNTDCPDADGAPSTPVPTATRACGAGTGANLTLLQPSVGGVTYEWWTSGIANVSKAPPNGTRITTNLTGYTTVGTVYLWAKNYLDEYSDTGAEITIDAASVGGTASVDQVIAKNTSSAALSLTGYTGTIQWQVSTHTDTSTFTNITGATAATLTPAQIGTLTTTTYYRAVVTNNSCSPATSSMVTITVLQPFTCDSKMYLSQGTTSAVTLSDVIASTNPFTYIAEGVAQSFAYNATAFNPTDGYLYSIKQYTNTTTGPLNILLRIGQGGVVQELGAVASLPSSGSAFYPAGEFDDAGNYYVKQFANNANLYKIDLSTSVARATPTATLITLDNTCEFPDFAYSVKDKLLYGVLGVVSGSNPIGTLTAIDPITKKVTFIGTSDATVNSFGAMYASSTGSVYGNYNSGGFYEFNTITGVRTLISSSPAASVNDGAHCVTAPITFNADLSVTKTDGNTQFMPGSKVTYTIVASNAGPFGVMNASVADALPTGIAAANFSYTAVASAGATTAVSGTQTGAINDLVSLPVGGTITYTVTASVPSSYSGNLSNSATITAPVSTNDPTPANNTATDVDTQCNTPAPISGGNQTVCATSPTVQTLTASATVGSGETLVWYDATTGGNLVSSPTLNSVGTVTYYAQANAGVCHSAARTPVQLTIHALPTITIAASTTSICYSENTAQPVSLAYTSTTGSPTKYSITWSSGMGAVTDATLGASPIIIQIPAGTASGTYTGTLTVKNVNGCSSTSNTFTVRVNPLPKSTYTLTPVSCNGGNDGRIVVTGSNGSGSYQYSIDDGLNYTSPAKAGSHTFPNLIAKDYTIKVKDTNGCVATP